MRYAPRDMGQVRLCLEGQPDDRKVKAAPDTGVTEEMVWYNPRSRRLDFAWTGP